MNYSELFKFQNISVCENPTPIRHSLSLLNKLTQKIRVVLSLCLTSGMEHTKYQTSVDWVQLSEVPLSVLLWFWHTFIFGGNILLRIAHQNIWVNTQMARTENAKWFQFFKIAVWGWWPQSGQPSSFGSGNKSHKVSQLTVEGMRQHDFFFLLASLALGLTLQTGCLVSDMLEGSQENARNYNRLPESKGSYQ